MKTTVLCLVGLLSINGLAYSQEPPPAEVNAGALNLDAITAALEKELTLHSPTKVDVPELEEIERELLSAIQLEDESENSPVPASIREDIDIYKMLLKAELTGESSPSIDQQRSLLATGKIIPPELKPEVRKDIDAYKKVLEAEDVEPEPAATEPPVAALVVKKEPPPKAGTGEGKPEKPAKPDAKLEKQKLEKKTVKKKKAEDRDDGKALQERFDKLEQELESKLEAQVLLVNAQVARFNARFNTYESRVKKLEQELITRFREEVDHKLAKMDQQVKGQLVELDRERQRLIRERKAGLKLETRRDRQLGEQLDEAMDTVRDTLYRELAAIKRKESQNQEKGIASLSDQMKSNDAQTRIELETFKAALVEEMRDYTEEELNARLKDMDLLLRSMAETREKEAATARKMLKRMGSPSGDDPVPAANIIRRGN